MSRSRFRDLGFSIGRMMPGPLNAITDVPGIRVGHATLIYDQPRIARTGVTLIVPSENHIWEHNLFAGFHSLNGNGDFTGTHWVAESGLLTTPIALTNTHQVGLVRDELVKIEFETREPNYFALPLVAETFDGWLNDINAHHLTGAHVRQALDSASGGPVAEGNVGGGTGMVGFNFKAGIGTASRRFEAAGGAWTLGALVQANFGERDLLRVDGIPVGQFIGRDVVPLARPMASQQGSIIVILATDAPLLPDQCKRIAQRAALGLARVGCIAHNSSGDLLFAFSTGNVILDGDASLQSVKMFPNGETARLFEAAIEATEEAVINALTAAETLTGRDGHTAQAIPLDLLAAAMEKVQTAR
jgi:D-aminopeptidase